MTRVAPQSHETLIKRQRKGLEHRWLTWQTGEQFGKLRVTGANDGNGRSVTDKADQLPKRPRSHILPEQFDNR